MNHQRGRTLQECTTSATPAEVLSAARTFFAVQSGVYSAFLERETPTHIVMRGQGGEELVIAVRGDAGVTHVTGASYLFDAQVARFLSSLAPAAVVTGSAA